MYHCAFTGRLRASTKTVTQIKIISGNFILNLSLVWALVTDYLSESIKFDTCMQLFPKVSAKREMTEYLMALVESL